MAHAISSKATTSHAFPFLQAQPNSDDLIVLEQDINHLSKDEMWRCLELCREALRPGGMVTLYGLNSANPITGSSSNADDFDHYQRLSELSMRQVLEWTGYENVRVFPLNLYVFWKNPLNYIGLAIVFLFTLFFRFCFLIYGKPNRIFTKKIGAIACKPKDRVRTAVSRQPSSILRCRLVSPEMGRGWGLFALVTEAFRGV
jgi:hypothetical protein